MRLVTVPLLTVVILASASGAQPGEGRSEEVVYANGPVTLAATLSIPPGSGPFPAAVLIHGSGTSDRSNAWTSAYAEALLARGVAVLHPDKRGAGASGGRWQEASFVDLARDAVAGLDLLLSRPEVDRSRVGFIGFSQGGHVVPIAATVSEDAAFVVNVSGSVVPLTEQIGDELRMMAQREGLSATEVGAVGRLHDLASRYALGGGEWDAYASAREEMASGPLGATEVVSGFPSTPDASVWGFLRAVGDFDPMPYWREVEVPTLFLYGGRDENVDVFKSADRIASKLNASALPYSLLLFRNNGHALYRDDALDFVARWIHDGAAD